MTTMVTAQRHHDICCGHRVAGQGGACENLHGHNYRINFVIAPKQGLDGVGRVLDFSMIKAFFANWLEDHWDHKMLLWEKDPILKVMPANLGVVLVPFNPTAENMAEYLVEKVGRKMLQFEDAVLVEVTVEETRKCSATYSNYALVTNV